MNPIEQVTAWLYRVTRKYDYQQREKRKVRKSGLFLSMKEEESVLSDFSTVLFADDERGNFARNGIYAFV